MQKGPYFIALLPPEVIMNEVLSIQKKISENYDSHVALKAPAHITLQKPFFRMKSQEPDLILKLNNFSTGHSGFEISLNGYGSFPPRTIFIRPEMTDDLKILYKSLYFFLKTQLLFNDKEVGNYKFNPHITIANRDLSKEGFDKAWKYYKGKEYKRKFMLNNISLLKHNGKNWDIYRKFNL